MNPLASIGRTVIAFFSTIGRICLFAGLAIFHCLQPPFYGRLLGRQLVEIGFYSLPVVGLTAIFTGMVLALQSYTGFTRFNAESAIASVVALSITRELAPVLAGLMVAGRIGAAMAAEIGTMRVTEQIDALTSMGANPIHYLVVPRLLACLCLIPALTVVANFMGVIGGAFYSIFILDIDAFYYWHNSRSIVGLYDLFSGIFKSLFFGFSIAILGCYRGFHCDPGAEGVGRAATAAFVHSFVVIIVLDLFLGIFLIGFHKLIWPAGGQLF